MIAIGNHLQITEDVSFYTHERDWMFRKEIPNIDFFGKMLIKDNVYIGSGACILPNITVESNVIIAVRSVVTKLIPEGVIVGGNPAKIIGYTEDYKLKTLKYNLGTKGLSHREKINKIKNADEAMFIKKPYLKDNK